MYFSYSEVCYTGTSSKPPVPYLAKQISHYFQTSESNVGPTKTDGKAGCGEDETSPVTVFLVDLQNEA